MIVAVVVVVVVLVVAVVVVLVVGGGHREDGELCSCVDCREARSRQAWVRASLAEARRRSDVDDAREGRWHEL